MLIEELLGCPLSYITRSYWAVKLNNDDWVCEARLKMDLARGEMRLYDWSNDLVSTGDVMQVKELWLFCPPSRTSPLGNTARLPIVEPGTAFQFKVATADSTGTRTVQAHIIGRVTNKETGDCECFIWDTEQDGLCTPETPIFTLGREPSYAGRTNVYNFRSWRPSIAPLGALKLDDLGVRL